MFCRNVDDKLAVLTAVGLDTGYAKAYFENASIALMMLFFVASIWWEFW